MHEFRCGHFVSLINSPQRVDVNLSIVIGIICCSKSHLALCVQFSLATDPLQQQHHRLIVLDKISTHEYIPSIVQIKEFINEGCQNLPNVLVQSLSSPITNLQFFSRSNSPSCDNMLLSAEVNGSCSLWMYMGTTWHLLVCPSLCGPGIQLESLSCQACMANELILVWTQYPVESAGTTMRSTGTGCSCRTSTLYLPNLDDLDLSYSDTTPSLSTRLQDRGVLLKADVLCSNPVVLLGGPTRSVVLPPTDFPVIATGNTSSIDRNRGVWIVSSRFITRYSLQSGRVATLSTDGICPSPSQWAQYSSSRECSDETVPTIILSCNDAQDVLYSLIWPALHVAAVDADLKPLSTHLLLLPDFTQSSLIKDLLSLTGTVSLSSPSPVPMDHTRGLVDMRVGEGALYILTRACCHVLTLPPRSPTDAHSIAATAHTYTCQLLKTIPLPSVTSNTDITALSYHRYRFWSYVTPHSSSRRRMVIGMYGPKTILQLDVMSSNRSNPASLNSMVTEIEPVSTAKRAVSESLAAAVTSEQFLSMLLTEPLTQTTLPCLSGTEGSGVANSISDGNSMGVGGRGVVGRVLKRLRVGIASPVQSQPLERSTDGDSMNDTWIQQIDLVTLMPLLSQRTVSSSGSQLWLLCLDPLDMVTVAPLCTITKTSTYPTPCTGLNPSQISNENNTKSDSQYGLTRPKAVTLWGGLHVEGAFRHLLGAHPGSVCEGVWEFIDLQVRMGDEHRGKGSVCRQKIVERLVSSILALIAAHPNAWSSDATTPITTSKPHNAHTSHNLTLLQQDGIVKLLLACGKPLLAAHALVVFDRFATLKQLHRRIEASRDFLVRSLQIAEMSVRGDDDEDRIDDRGGEDAQGLAGGWSDRRNYRLPPPLLCDPPGTQTHHPVADHSIQTAIPLIKRRTDEAAAVSLMYEVAR